MAAWGGRVRSVTPRCLHAAALLDGLFEHPAHGLHTVPGSIQRFSCRIAHSAIQCGYGAHCDLDGVVSQVSG